MQRIVIILLGLASLAAGGVLLDRGGRVGLTGQVGLGLQTMQGMPGGVGGLGIGIGSVGGGAMSREELLRQKFILDVLHQVYQPLQQQELLLLDDPNTVANENLYIRPLTREMLMVLDNIRQQQMLGKHTICRITNDLHMQQMLGLYRLLVNARDFETFQRLVVHARQNINTEMFVNSLILALGERNDTKTLIIPALYEILAEIYHKDQVIDQVIAQVNQMDTGVSSVRPQLLDVIGMGRQNRLMNMQQQQQQQEGGLLGVLNRSQLWMPWREFHRQLAWRKMMLGGRGSGFMGDNVMQQQGQSQVDKLEVPLPGNGLLSQDIGLKAYVNILIDELVVNQDNIRNSINQQRIGTGGILGGRGQINNMGGLSRNRVGGYDDDLQLNTQHGIGLGGGRGQVNIMGGLGRQRGVDDDDERLQINSQSGIGWSGGRGQTNTLGDGVNTDRLLFIGRRQRGNNDIGVTDIDDIQDNGGRRHGLNIDYEHAMDRNRVMMGGRRLGQVGDETQNQHIYGNDDLLMGGGRRGLGNTYQQDLQRNQGQIGRRNLQEGENGINTVSVNDARLLFVGRRRKDPNNVETISGGNIHDDDDIISGGRHVSNEGKNEQRQKNKHHNNDYDDEDTLYNSRGINNERYINVNRRGMLLDQNQYDAYNDLPWNRQQGRYGQQQIYDDNIYGYMNRGKGQGIGMGVGHGRNDFLSIVNRGRMGQRQPFDNEQDLLWNQGGNIDINDEQLLRSARQEGRRVTNTQQDVYDDEENPWQSGRQRGNSQIGSGRGQSYRQHNSYDVNQRGNQDRGQNRATHRYRRSLIDQQQNINNADSVTGKLLLHTLQQLVARLNVERIALGQPQLIDLGQQDILNNNLGGHLTINANNIRGLDVHTVQKIEEILQRIDQVLEQRIGDISVMTYQQKVNEIGLLLAGQMEEIGLIQLLGEILQQGTVQQQHRKGQVANILENQGVQVLLAGIVKIIDDKVQKVYRTRKEFINTLEGVTIHDVDVDQLQTYLEYDNIDLSNLVKNNLDHTKEVVGRVPRLNHKNFKIEIDVTSDRQQQVVVRNLLVPKVDGQGNKIQLQKRRQNVIVLDITTAQLNPGHNLLKLHSNDITITARDTTPLTEIYQHVMQALNCNGVLNRNLLMGQTNKLPHRLLLPRGRTNGLPMLLITAITRVQGSAASISGTSSALDLLLLDNLPMTYPLHCDLTDLDDAVNMANLMVKDVKIYHDDNIQLPGTHFY